MATDSDATRASNSQVSTTRTPICPDCRKPIDQIVPLVPPYVRVDPCACIVDWHKLASIPQVYNTEGTK